MSKLAFGYNQIPDNVEVAWGARLIVTQDGGVDLVWDRTDTIGPDGAVRQQFLDRLNDRYPMERLRDDLSRKLREREVNTRESGEVTLYSDDDLVVVGNSNASAGYFYVSAYRLP